MKAVIYARYSSDSQREESIEGQIRECTAFAEKNGITVLRHYIDRAFSAKTDNRPEFQNMIKDSGKKLFDTVIVWKLDRFARNRYDSARHKATLKKNGVKVVSATEAIADGSVGIMMETILEGMAEYYSVDLSEKVVRGMTDNALKCMFNGGTKPIGYIIDKEQRFQIDPITSPFVLAAFEKYADGATMKEVRDYLNEHGVTNTKGKPMTYNSVQHLLNNRRYIGEYVYREIIVPDGIPAIVPLDLFERVQEKIAKNRKAPARSKAEEEYLLTTKLFCGHCGAYLCGESGTSRSGLVHHYYKCVSVKKKRAVCHKKPVKKRWIEDLAVTEAMKVVMDDDAIDAIITTLMDMEGRENTRLPLYQQQLRETEAKIENLLKAITEGVFTKFTKKLLEELEKAKEELENRIALEKLEKPQISEAFIRYWFYSLRKLDMSKTAHRQMLIDGFINAIFLYDDRMLITFNYKEDTKTITFEDVKNEASENCSGSTLDCKSAPKNPKELMQFLGILIKWRVTTMSHKKYYSAYDDRYRQVHQQGLQWFSGTASPIVMETMESFGITQQHRLLEVGCGEGRDAYPLLKQGFNLLATDVSPEAISFCKDQFPDYAEHFQVLDCIAETIEEKFHFIYAVAVLHMLVPDEDRNKFYHFVLAHLSDNGIALICTMGDGTLEFQTDISTAFDIQERTHGQSGKRIKVAATSCRPVTFPTFERELQQKGLAVLRQGLTAVEPDFPQMMYAVVNKA